ncbi:MAG: hypothetical protein WCU00_12440 [Candidatus Latescibacterota bacterium]
MKKHSKFTGIIVIIFSLFYVIPLFGESKSVISDQYVLRSPYFSLPEYIFKNKIKIFLKEYRKNNIGTVPADSMESWIDQIKDSMYFLTDAYRIGLDKTVKVNDTVNIMSKTIVTQPRGVLYDNLILNKIHVDENEILEAYNKYDKTVSYEFILFRDENKMRSLIGNCQTPVNEQIFRKIADMCDENSTMEYLKSTSVWPFFGESYISDYLYTNDKNTFSKPLFTTNGIYIVHIIDSETNESNTTYKELYPSIKARLEFCKEIQLFCFRRKWSFPQREVVVY